MKKSASISIVICLLCLSCNTKYIRIGRAQPQPLCADAQPFIIHQLGKSDIPFIKNYLKLSICDKLIDRQGLLDLIDLKEVVPTVGWAQEVLGEPLHIYTNRQGMKAYFYVSYAHDATSNGGGVCEINDLFVIFYEKNDSLSELNAFFYNYLQGCDGDDDVLPYLSYWNNPNIPKESKYGDKYAPVDFRYKNGSLQWDRLEHNTFPSNSVNTIKQK